MPTSDVSIALLRQALETLDTRLTEQDKRITALQDERDRAIKWGLVALGSMVMGMGAFIVQLFKDRFGG